MAVKPGDILGNRYRIDALIGRGGMGHVFAATDLSGPAPPVAIKVVSRVVFDETLLARLHREAEAAARIKSDYVPHVLEVSDTDNREMYLVMERLVGEPLSQRMKDKGPLPWSEVVQIGQDVLRGLIDAHTAGVVHRDIKPSNVFLAMKNGRMRAMVLDFGVCKTDAVDHERLTGTGESIGTVAYMAPEQIRGASKVDDRADLYAFGVLVFEMISGRLPHDGPSQMAILASKLENTPARLRDHARVMVPDGLDALVGKALQRDPNARFSSAQELLKAWRKLGAADVSASLPPSSLPDAAARAEDMHDAPTAVSVPLGEHGAAASGDAPSVPVEAHPTQTAMTGGIPSLRRAGPGRLALVLAACALATGVIGVVAFFARGPDGAGDTAQRASGAGAIVSTVAAPTAAPASAAVPAAAPPVAPPVAIELGDDDPRPPGALSPTSPVGPDPHKPAVTTTGPRPARTSRPATAPAKSSGPHITSQPRY